MWSPKMLAKRSVSSSPAAPAAGTLIARQANVVASCAAVLGMVTLSFRRMSNRSAGGSQTPTRADYLPTLI